MLGPKYSITLSLKKKIRKLNYKRKNKLKRNYKSRKYLSVRHSSYQKAKAYKVSLKIYKKLSNTDFVRTILALAYMLCLLSTTWS